MKRLWIWPLAALILSSSLSAKTFRDKKEGFYLEFDQKRWEIPATPQETRPAPGQLKDEAKAPRSRTLFALQRKEAEENYFARFSVVEEKADKFVGEKDPLKAYFLYSLDFLKSQRLDNVKTRKSRSVVPLLGTEAYEITGTQRDFGLSFRQVVFIKGGKAYQLTSATRTKLQADYQKELDSLFASFGFLAE